jgi:Spy/CpxP family protein refolding chaperone
VAYLQAKAQLENAIMQNNQNLSGYTSNLATAQTNLIQLRMQREAYLASILTPEQKNIWNQIQARKAARLQDRINELQGQ